MASTAHHNFMVLGVPLNMNGWFLSFRPEKLVPKLRLGTL